MEKRKFTEKQLSTKCEHWEQLTDWNNHGECMLDIAKFFKLDTFAGVFKHINEIHNLLGSLPYTLFEFRYMQYKKMLECIRIAYGDEIALRVRKCT